MQMRRSGQEQARPISASGRPRGETSGRSQRLASIRPEGGLRVDQGRKASLRVVFQARYRDDDARGA